MTRMRAVRSFSSIPWGNVDAGELFDVEDGYVRGLEADGMAMRLHEPAPASEPEPQPVRRRGRPRKRAEA